MPETPSPDAQDALPLLALRSTLVFPRGRIAVQIGSGENQALLAAHPEEGALVCCALTHEEGPGGEGRAVGRVGVVARLTDRRPPVDGLQQVTLEGLSRVTITGVVREAGAGFARATVRPADETAPETEAARELMHRILLAADARAERDENFPAELAGLLRREVTRPGRFADLAAARGALRAAEKDEALQRLDVHQRLAYLAERFEREEARATVHHEVRQETERRIDRHHREFFLRQQLQAIKAELGEAEVGDRDLTELSRRIEAAALPEAVAT